MRFFAKVWLQIKHTDTDNTDKASVATTFTAEEETLFARRYENGYNISNPQYVH